MTGIPVGIKADCTAISLQALAKYAFGLGTITMALSTAAFTLFALPVGNGIGTQILIKVFHAPPKLAAIRTVDEAIVIGAALSLSSSAFVLQLMAEQGALATKFGSATLGILLLQVRCLVTHGYTRRRRGVNKSEQVAKNDVV